MNAVPDYATLGANSTRKNPAASKDLCLIDRDLATGQQVRLACRAGSLTRPTCGLAPTYLQANLIVLPSQYADDFRALCQRNPVPCPLLAESAHLGSYSALKSWMSAFSGQDLAANLDIRHDLPRYNVYRDGQVVVSGIGDVEDYWTDDHVAFLIGCSFSFEADLARQGLAPAHVSHGTNVPMYRTTIPLCPSGVFQHSTYVVSMRLYPLSDVETVRAITRPYARTHGEPLAWGVHGARSLGIRDLATPQWGDQPVMPNGNMLGSSSEGGLVGDEILAPVFWGCGVTPQEAVVKAGLQGTVMAHAPGHMLVLDLRDWDVASSTIQ